MEPLPHPPISASSGAAFVSFSPLLRSSPWLLVFFILLVIGWSSAALQAAAPAIALQKPMGHPLTSGTSTVVLTTQAAGAPNAPTTFTILNQGNAPLNLTSVSVKDGDSVDFAVDSTDTLASVPTGGSTTFTVTFTLDDASATRSTTLEILSDDPALGTFDVALTGAIGPQIVVEQPAGQALTPATSTVDYGTVRQGHSSTLTYTVRNTGTAILTINGLTVTGPNSAAFVQDITNLPPTLGSNETGTFTVTFTPRSAIGAQNADVHIISSDSELSDLEFGVTGTTPNIPELVVLNPSGNTVANGVTDLVGTVPIGHPKSCTYTIQNAGPAPLTFQLALINADNGNVTVEDGFATTLASGASTNVTFDLSPARAMAANYDFSITSNDSGQSPFSLIIQAQGLNVPTILVQSTPATGQTVTYSNTNIVTFGTAQVGQPETLTFNISDLALQPLTISSITLGGDSAAKFTVDQSGVPASISSDTPGVLKVTYTPTAVLAGGLDEATLEIDSDAYTDGTFVLNLRGNGADMPPSIEVDQPTGTALVSGTSTITLVTNSITISGGTPDNSTTFVIVNNGGADLDLSGLSITGVGAASFILDTTNTLSTLPAGLSTSFTVALVLSDPTARPTATLQIASNDPTTPTFSVGLKGTLGDFIVVSQGSQSLTASGSQVDFGSVNLGQSASLSFTIQNPGGTARAIGAVSVVGGEKTDFVVDTTGLATSLAAGAQTSFSVTFKPTALQESTTLLINSDDPKVHTYTITLTGTGVQPVEVTNTVSLAAGDSAPGADGPSGLPAEAKLTTFGVPATDDASDLAYTAQWAVNHGAKGTGLFLNDQCLAIVGGQFAPLPGTNFKTFGVPVVDAGVVALPATFTEKVSGIITFTAVSGSAPIPALIAQIGEAAPDEFGAIPSGSPKFKTFKGVSIRKGVVAIYATVSGGTGATRATAANDQGIWVKEPSGVLTRVFAENDKPLPANSAKVLTSFALGNGSPGQGRGWLTTPSGGGAPHVLLYSTLSGGLQGVFDDSLGGTPTLIAQTKTTDSTGPGIQGASFASIGVPATNDAGQFAFRASLGILKNVVTAATAQGIFFHDVSNANQALARLGSAAGSTGATFSAFKDPVLSEDGGIAFPATLKGGGLKGANTNTLWWQPFGETLAPLAQAGVATVGVPNDLPTGAQWASFTSLAIAADRGPIFTATLALNKGGVKAATASGIWAVDSAGKIRTLVRTGDTTIITGETLTSFNFLKASVGSMGVTRSFNGHGQIVWLATFKNKSQAIITTSIP